MPIKFDHNLLTLEDAYSTPLHKKEQVKYNYSDADLLKQFEFETERLGGRMPTTKEIKEAHLYGRTASYGTFMSRFGGWKNVFREFKEYERNNKISK